MWMDNTRREQLKLISLMNMSLKSEMEQKIQLLRSKNQQLKSHVSFLCLKPPSVSRSVNTPTASFSDSTEILFLQPFNSDSDSYPDCGVPVHRFVLVSRSPIFKKMLNIHEELKLSTPNRVLKVPDATPQLLESFVKFLYNGEIDTTLDADTARDLLILGDKYQVQFLKTCCEEYLCTKVKVHAISANTLYEFARQYNAQKLLHVCHRKFFFRPYLKDDVEDIHYDDRLSIKRSKSFGELLIEML